MIFISTMTYPGKSCAPIARKMVDILANNPPPDYIKRTYYVVLDGKIKTYSIYEMEDEKAGGFKEVAKRLVDAMQTVEDIEIKFEPAFSIEESFSMIDMQAP